MLRAAKRGPQAELPMPPNVSLPEPTRRTEPVWLEPYPDVSARADLEGPPGPRRATRRRRRSRWPSSTALQLLPARQRAVLILRDVLGFRASEVAGMLDSTVESVTSALKRARATLEGRPRPEAPPPPDSPVERELVSASPPPSRRTTSTASSPCWPTTCGWRCPAALEYVGREEAARFYEVVATRPGRRRLVPTRANGQPALAFYSQDVKGDEYVASSLAVVTLAGDRVVAIDRFDASVLPHFGLALILRD